ncbi:hypothetical protein JCM8208_006272 [Rhodotorula glutinis]
MSTRPCEPDLVVEQPAPPEKRPRTTTPRARPAGGSAKRPRTRRAPPQEVVQEPLQVFVDASSSLHGSGALLQPQGGFADDFQLDPALFALDSLFADATQPLGSTAFDSSVPHLATPPPSFYDSSATLTDPELSRLIARLSESAPPPDPAVDGAFLPFPASPDTDFGAHSRAASSHSYISLDGPALVLDSNLAPSPALAAAASTLPPPPAPVDDDPRAHDIPVRYRSPKRTDGKRRRALKWTEVEDDALVRLKDEASRDGRHIEWEEVAARIGTRHTGVQCRARYLLLKDKEKIRSSTENNLTQGSTKDGRPLALRQRLPFREMDDAVLLSHLIDASLVLKRIEWSHVGQTLDPPRTGDSCYQRARKLKLRREADLAAQADAASSGCGSAHASATGTPAPGGGSTGVGTPASMGAQDEVTPKLLEEMLARALEGDIPVGAAVDAAG